MGKRTYLHINIKLLLFLHRVIHWHVLAGPGSDPGSLRMHPGKGCKNVERMSVEKGVTMVLAMIVVLRTRR